MSAGEVGAVDPETAWAALSANPSTLLIDVRTRPEWTFVGIPDLSPIAREAALIEWQRYPDMAVNGAFAEEALAAAEAVGAETVFFICRSGVRSLSAAAATADAAAAAGRKLDCVNVEAGFEGVLGAEGRRSVNGWKNRGLPWRQS